VEEKCDKSFELCWKDKCVAGISSANECSGAEDTEGRTIKSGKEFTTQTAPARIAVLYCAGNIMIPVPDNVYGESKGAMATFG
jgi:hypothetical protein